MSLQLLSIIDPRDNLEKARRTELVAFARQNGVANIDEQTPAIVIRKMLRTLGLTRIRIPDRVLGQPTLAASGFAAVDDVPGAVVNEVSVEDDLARQYERTTAKNAHQMNYNELRREGRRLGLKFGRKDNLPIIKAKVAAALQKAPPA